MASDKVAESFNLLSSVLFCDGCSLVSGDEMTPKSSYCLPPSKCPITCLYPKPSCPQSSRPFQSLDKPAILLTTAEECVSSLLYILLLPLPGAANWEDYRVCLTLPFAALARFSLASHCLSRQLLDVAITQPLSFLTSIHIPSWPICKPNEVTISILQ